ncbi:hypothetical protein Barb6_03269 [Bacteroidales bacterium Barb6]|nr:hypothetical protein Barb6_03269 [Bacteroidales bacterium Barb6]
MGNEELFGAKQVESDKFMELYKTGFIDLRFAGESHFGLTPNVPYAQQHKCRQRQKTERVRVDES